MADYSQYIPLNALVAQDATTVEPYKEPIVKPRSRGEIRALPANQRPLEWQLQTGADNYNAIHNKIKQLWDAYIVPPDIVQEAQDYYNNELPYSDNPVAIPIAALGSTLSGEAYNAYRDLQTDPANLLGGEILRAGDKVGDALGAVKMYKSKNIIVPPNEVIIPAKTFDDANLFHGSAAKFEGGFKSGADQSMLENAAETGYGGQYLGGGTYVDDNQMANLLQNLNAIIGKSGKESGYQYIANVDPALLANKQFINTRAPAYDFIKSVPEGEMLWVDAGMPNLIKEPEVIDLSKLQGAGINPSTLAKLEEYYATQAPKPLTTEDLLVAYRNNLVKLTNNKPLANRFVQQQMAARDIAGSMTPSAFRLPGSENASEWVFYDPNALKIVDRQEVTRSDINELLEEMRSKFK